ncbi:MAG TPA: hypothetical protein VGM86_01035 [Thermoanaerobaculia bacterium]|jgi:hypothetical protein
MTIEINGIPEGESVNFQILQDCHSRGMPDLTSFGACKNPVIPPWKAVAGSGNRIHYRLDFKAPANRKLPRDTSLWLRASLPGSSNGNYVRFALGNPCSVWKDLVGSFFGGTCKLGLLQALSRHLGPSGFEGIVFEVRRIDPSHTPPKVSPVPGTRGATGVTWLDSQTLAVTVAPTSATTGGGGPGHAALLRVPIDGQAPFELWSLPGSDSRVLAAPFQLPDGRIAFVLQKPGETLEGVDAPALLKIWSDGRVDTADDIELPYKIHQILASDKTGRSLLLLSLGVGANRPVLLSIDLPTRTVTSLGFHNGLYNSALRSPRNETSVVAFEDNSGQSGWDLALVDSHGKFLQDLQTRPEDDLLPAWRPDGAEIAFLAEVNRESPPR